MLGDGREASLVTLWVYPDKKPELSSVRLARLNSDKTMPQVSMASDPTEDMQIATKQYVDDALAAIVDGTEVAY